MLKKVLVIFILMPLLLTGCKSSHKIETASIIENVSVHRQDGRLTYTFYILTDSDSPNAVAIPADSFEQAAALAERKYIPDMSLSKLELLLIERNVCGDVMRDDIEYISTQASFSPIAYVALCDDSAIKLMREKTSAQESIENLLILCKKNNHDVKTDYLSVFNSYAGKKDEVLRVPFVSAENELKVTAVEITQKK